MQAVWGCKVAIVAREGNAQHFALIASLPGRCHSPLVAVVMAAGPRVTFVYIKNTPDAHHKFSIEMPAARHVFFTAG